jgi:hypothetical protein
MKPRNVEVEGPAGEAMNPEAGAGLGASLTAPTRRASRKKAKQPEVKQEVKPVEVKPTEVKAQPVEVKPVEVKPETKPEVKPTPTPEAKPTTKPEVKIKSITWEEFEEFAPERNIKRSWVKEAIERATREPVKIEGLTRGQIMALLNQVDKHNLERREPKIIAKYDIKKGVVLLAPVAKQLQTNQ